MRSLTGAKNWNERWHKRAKAVRGKTTARAKAIKQIDYQNRLWQEIELVERYYAHELKFWRFCRHKQCLRARTCKGEPELCLQRSLHTVPFQQIRQAQRKLLKGTPLHIGAVELKVRTAWPSEFWKRPVNPAVIEKAVAKERRKREFAEELETMRNPCEPDGLTLRRKSRRRCR